MPAASQQMRYWVDIAIECVRVDHTPSLSSGDQTGPFFTARALGMALGALNDGYVLAKGSGTQLLMLGLTAPSGLEKNHHCRSSLSSAVTPSLPQTDHFPERGMGLLDVPLQHFIVADGSLRDIWAASG